jgi:outer membrane protein assembly factor BamE (lipoprotein component of BamABCDE complex)
MVFFLLVSCVRREKGFYFGNVDMARNLDAYNSTKNDLINNFGEPSMELDEDVWLYYSYTYNNPLFRKNKIYNEKILMVYFDKNDKITSHSFNERKLVGDITDIKQEKEGIDGNMLKEFFDGLILSPISNDNSR